jgi:hypothetical protein
MPMKSGEKMKFSIFVAVLVSSMIANAEVNLTALCKTGLKDGKTTSVVSYEAMKLSTVGKQSHLLKNLNLDLAQYGLLLTETGIFQGGGTAFKVVLARVEDDQSIHYGKKPKVKGSFASSANVQSTEAGLFTTWLNQKTKEIGNTFPIQLEIAYKLKKNWHSSQKISVSCTIDEVKPALAEQCEGEAQILEGKILSTQYIAGVGCKTAVGSLKEVQPNVMCKTTLFDVDIENEGLVIGGPSPGGCSAKAGEKFSGVAERHGKYIYLGFNPEKTGLPDLFNEKSQRKVGE